MSVEPETYRDVHRYDGVVIQHDRRDRVVPCVVQPRDVAILRDVWRLRFLTAAQLLALWWPAGAAWPGQRRLRKLHEAGYLERFRPLARRGSFPWTYQLGRAGHQLLQQEGTIGRRQRYEPRAVYDYSYVLHDIQLNAWLIAWRAALGERLVDWHGETHIEPPPLARRGQLPLDQDWSVEGIAKGAARPVRPDALVKVARDGTGNEPPRTFLIEFDRTRRVDKNYDKFRRYDAFATAWWRHSALFADEPSSPFIIFVCQDTIGLQHFMGAADAQLGGHRVHPAASPHEHVYPGRKRMLFCSELAMHQGDLQALALPSYPVGHLARRGEHARRSTLQLPGVLPVPP